MFLKSPQDKKKMKEIIWNNFYGGVAESSREQSNYKFDLVKHFDVNSDSKKLIPYPTIVANNSGVTAATHTPGNFISNGSIMFLLCRKGAPADNYVSIFKNSDTNAAWKKSTTAESSTVLTGDPAVTTTGTSKAMGYYGTKIYGISTNGVVWAYDTSSNTFSDNSSYPSYNTTVTGISRTPGIVGDAVGYFYLSLDNIIYQNSGSAWTVGLTLASGTSIYGMENFGSYLGILTGNYLQLWDFSSSLVTEVVSLPNSGYKCLGKLLEGLVLVGQRTFGSSVEINVAVYSGGAPQIIWKRVFPSTVSLLTGGVRSFNGKVYFVLNDSGTGRPYQGIWCVGKNSSKYPLSVSLAFDYLENGGDAANIINFYISNTNSTATGNLGIYILTDDYKIHKINGTAFASVSPISYFETTKLRPKTYGCLRAVSCSYEKLPANASITVSYKADAETSWTDIFTDSVENSVRYDATCIESTGARLPEKFSEIQFRVKSLSGAEPIELKVKYEEIPDDYDGG